MRRNPISERTSYSDRLSALFKLAPLTYRYAERSKTAATEHPDTELTGHTFLAVAETLVQAVKLRTQVETVVLFVGGPPLPLAFDTTASHRQRLDVYFKQGYREQIVERAIQHRLLQWEIPKQVSDGCGLINDSWALAYPIAADCCLYLGSALPNARLLNLGALEKLVAPYADRLQRSLRQTRLDSAHDKTKTTLKEATNLLDTLQKFIKSVERLSRSLDPECLMKELQDLVLEHVPHHSGLITVQERSLLWGGSISTDLGVGQNSNPAAETWTGDNVLRVPLLDAGQLVLDAGEGNLFKSEDLRYLRLLAQHAGMALSNAALHQQVRDANRQLEESRAELLQASKVQAVGQLGAGVAHELNTPLAALTLQMELLRDHLTDDPEKARSLIARAEETIESMAAVVSRLLAYSKRSDGRLIEVDLAELVDETILLLNHSFTQERVSIVLRRTGETPALVCRQDLRQAVASILFNAVEAFQRTPEQTDRKIEIDLEESEETISLGIGDNGPGMSEEERSRCFEPFFTTKPVGKGPGLGLWVAYRIAEQHGGFLRLDSSLGEFTKVTMTLPKAKAKGNE